MLTDRLPKQIRLRAEYQSSDRLCKLDLPTDDRLRGPAAGIEAALQTGQRPPVLKACSAFVAAAADFYSIPGPRIRVLAARPLQVREDGGATELFGDYHFENMTIRVWMRTAVQKRVTSFGTFLSTLCHEFCHHLDRERFGFRETPHTRGFYERTAALYHHARSTSAKPLFWVPLANGQWRIDWPRTNRGA